METERPPPPTVPVVDPIGIVRYPEGHAVAARGYAPRTKAMAWAMLVVFGLVVVVTTGASLGHYCLTSDGADLSALSPFFGL